MLSKKIEKCKDIILILSIYVVFIFLSILGKTPNIFYNVFKILPDFDLLFLFILFFVKGFNHFYYIHLFLFGIILDVFEFSPIGVNSMSLLLTYKAYFVLKQFLFYEDKIFYFLRDSAIFFVLFYFLKWFLISFYNNQFLNIGYVLFMIIKNIAYMSLYYYIANKQSK